MPCGTHSAVALRHPRGCGSALLDVRLACMTFKFADSDGSRAFRYGDSPEGSPNIAVLLHLPVFSFWLSELPCDVQSKANLILHLVLIIPELA